MSAASDHDRLAGLAATDIPRPIGQAGTELSGGPRLEISRELRAEWLRLVASLRRALHASVELDAPPGRVRQLADRVAEISLELQSHARGRPVPLYHSRPETLGPDDLNAMLPFSPVMGRYNPLAPPIALSLEGDRIVARVRLLEGYQGAAGVVHGGVVAAIFDEVLGMAAIVNGMPGPTASLKVDYRAPTPLLTDLRFEAWVDRVQRRRTHVKGECFAEEQLLVEAEAIFVRPTEASGWARLGSSGAA